jgi:acetyltransferase
VQSWTTKDGTDVIIRPIRPEDEPLMVEFHKTLSERTVYMRYLQAMNLSQRVGHDRLSRLSFIDYAREMVLVAIKPNNDNPELMAVARLTKQRWTDAAEFALLVSDRFQHQGLGRELLQRLLEVARTEKIGRVYGDFLTENTEMNRLAEKLGFQLKPTDRPGIMRAEIVL